MYGFDYFDVVSFYSYLVCWVFSSWKAIGFCKMIFSCPLRLSCGFFNSIFIRNYKQMFLSGFSIRILLASEMSCVHKVTCEEFLLVWNKVWHKFIRSTSVSYFISLLIFCLLTCLGLNGKVSYQHVLLSISPCTCCFWFTKLVTMLFVA